MISNTKLKTFSRYIYLPDQSCSRLRSCGNYFIYLENIECILLLMLVFNAKLLSHVHFANLCCICAFVRHSSVCLFGWRECLKLVGIQTLFLQVCLMMIVEQELHASALTWTCLLIKRRHTSEKQGLHLLIAVWVKHKRCHL